MQKINSYVIEQFEQFVQRQDYEYVEKESLRQGDIIFFVNSAINAYAKTGVVLDKNTLLIPEPIPEQKPFFDSAAVTRSARKLPDRKSYYKIGHIDSLKELSTNSQITSLVWNLLVEKSFSNHNEYANYRDTVGIWKSSIEGTVFFMFTDVDGPRQKYDDYRIWDYYQV